MGKKIPLDIADLIVAKLNDSITEAECEKLNEWLDASEEHRRLYGEWLRGERFDVFRKECREHDYLPKYEELCARIRTSKRRRSVKRWMWTAAAVVVPFVLFFWSDLLRERVPVPEEQIVPGQYEALLTLPDGRKVSLAQNDCTVSLENTSAEVYDDTLTYKAGYEGVIAEQNHVISIPRGGEYVMKLADGTRVWLNSETELSYPAVFSGRERRVVLRGEAYFEVAHDSLHPFVVEAGPQRLTVLGTCFAVRAYETEAVIRTTLEAGRVRVQASNESVELTPGYQSCLEGGKITKEKVNTSLYTAWHKGIFLFMDQPLEDILATLGRWYNIEVFYAVPDLKNIRFTGELQRYADIREFLDKIQRLEKVRFSIKGRAVTVERY